MFFKFTLMTIDQKTLIDIKQALLTEKVQLEKDLQRIAKPIDPQRGDYEPVFDEVGNDREDNTTEVEEYTDNLPIELALEQKLQAIILALDKIDNHQYGVCEKCHQEIAIERLKVNPSAKTCISCN
jgi:DnaK suppressor protein